MRSPFNFFCPFSWKDRCIYECGGSVCLLASSFFASVYVSNCLFLLCLLFNMKTRWCHIIMDCPPSRNNPLSRGKSSGLVEQVGAAQARAQARAQAADRAASSCSSFSFSCCSSTMLCWFCCSRSSSHCSSGPLTADIWLHRFLVNTEPLWILVTGSR